jgi:hypothetical protein
MAKGLFPGYVAGVVMAKASLGVDLCMIRSPDNGTKPFWLSSITQLNQKNVSSAPRLYRCPKCVLEGHGAGCEEIRNSGSRAGGVEAKPWRFVTRRLVDGCRNLEAVQGG